MNCQEFIDVLFFSVYGIFTKLLGSTEIEQLLLYFSAYTACFAQLKDIILNRNLNKNNLKINLILLKNYKNL